MLSRADVGMISFGGVAISAQWLQNAITAAGSGVANPMAAGLPTPGSAPAAPGSAPATLPPGMAAGSGVANPTPTGSQALPSTPRPSAELLFGLRYGKSRMRGRWSKIEEDEEEEMEMERKRFKKEVQEKAATSEAK